MCILRSRIGPSTTDLLTCLHRGAWWVKLDLIGKLRSGAAATSRAIRSFERHLVSGWAVDSQAGSGPVKAARPVSWAAEWPAVGEPQIGGNLR
jgi:hypothetical protein